MNIIKLSDNVGELEAVKDKASEELQYLRSLDTAGDGQCCIVLQNMTCTTSMITEEYSKHLENKNSDAAQYKIFCYVKNKENYMKNVKT